MDTSSLEKLSKLRAQKAINLPENNFFKGILRPYQTIGTANLIFSKRTILGDDTGLGKTAMSIAAICILFDKQRCNKAFVVTTSSALLQWEEEIKKFTNNLSVKVIGSRKHKTYTTKQRVEALKDKADIYVCPYSLLAPGKKFRSEVYKTLGELIDKETILIFDEISAIKNPSAQRSKLAKLIANKAGRVWGLTATLIKNNILDVYGIYKVVNPKLFSTREEFGKDYLIEIPIPGKKYAKMIVGNKNLKHLRNKIDPFYLSRRKAQVAPELPKIISSNIKLEMSPLQQRLYKSVLDGTFERKDGRLVKRDEEGSMGVLAEIAYCQLIANTPATVGYQDKSAKASELIRMVDEDLFDSKIVIYSNFKKWVYMLSEKFSDLGIKHCRITGDDSSDERNEAVKLFTNDKDTRVIFLTKAGSEALNLQVADTLIFMDLPLSFGTYYQTIGRLQRIGSKSKVINLYHFIADGTVDERILKLLQGKFDVAKTVADVEENLFDAPPLTVKDYEEILGK